MSNNEVTVIELPVDDGQRIKQIIDHVSAWCAAHQWEVGVAEMAAGAALVAAGLQSGAVQMAVDVVISTLSDELTARFYGGLAGSSIGALAAHLLGNIGIAAVGTAIAIPAVVLMGGGALVLGLAGYGVGELITQFLHPLPSLVDFSTGGSLVAVGAALLAGGARRIAKDEDVKQVVADFKDGALRLGKVAYVSSLVSLAALHKYLAEEAQPFLEDVTRNPATAAATAALTAAGLAGGQAVAVGTVSVLGSSSLGALGVSLGLVSVPLWPVVAGGGVALAVAYGVWRVTKRRTGNGNLLLPPPTNRSAQDGKA